MTRHFKPAARDDPRYLEISPPINNRSAAVGGDVNVCTRCGRGFHPSSNRQLRCRRCRRRLRRRRNGRGDGLRRRLGGAICVVPGSGPGRGTRGFVRRGVVRGLGALPRRSTWGSRIVAARGWGGWRRGWCVVRGARRAAGRTVSWAVSLRRMRSGISGTRIRNRPAGPDRSAIVRRLSGMKGRGR